MPKWARPNGRILANGVHRVFYLTGVTLSAYLVVRRVLWSGIQIWSDGKHFKPRARCRPKPGDWSSPMTVQSFVDVQLLRPVFHCTTCFIPNLVKQSIYHCRLGYLFFKFVDTINVSFPTEAVTMVLAPNPYSHDRRIPLACVPTHISDPLLMAVW